MPEQIVVLNLSDVQGIRIECRKCRSSVSLRLNENEVQIPQVCPGCRADWTGFTTRQAFVAAHQLLEAIRHRWDELTPPFDIRFEVTGSD
jgi:hypothetical protein